MSERPARAGFNRRGFLKVGALGAFALASGSALTMWRASGRYRRLIPAGAQPRVLSVKELAILTAFVDVVLPDQADWVTARAARIAERIDKELSFHGKKMQDDVKGALLVVEHGGWAHLSPQAFTSRSPDEQVRYLDRMQTGASLERQAFSGLRLLAVFFYYCDERSWPNIHYDGPLVSIPSPPAADSALIVKLERR